MKKTRILYVHHTFREQSYNSQLWEFVKRTDRNRYDIWITCLREGGPYAGRFQELGARVKNFNMGSVLDLRIIYRLISFIKAKKIDIVHTGLLPADIYGRISAKIAGVPFIVSTIHNIDDYRRERKYFPHLIGDRLSMLCNTHIITCAKAVEREIARWPETRHKLMTIYYGIDKERFHSAYDTGSLKRELGLDGHHPIIGTVARHFHQKRLDKLIEAASSVLKVHPFVQFLLVGDGPLSSKLKEMARRRGISRNIVFTGFRQDIPELLATMDIFVLPSLWEGLPNSIIEAMLAERPVISTNVCGIPEEIDDGITGILIPPGDSDRLAEAIIELLNAPEMWARMGRLGRKKALELFGVERMVENYDRFYSALMESSKGNR